MHDSRSAATEENQHDFSSASCYRAQQCLLSCCLPRPSQSQTLDKLSIVIFSAPSLGAFMPPIIKAKKIDQAHGLDISFQERTPDAYTAQFNSGEFKVGGRPRCSPSGSPTAAA